MEIILKDNGVTKMLAQVKEKYKGKGEKVLDIRMHFKPKGQKR